MYKEFSEKISNTLFPLHSMCWKQIYIPMPMNVSDGRCSPCITQSLCLPIPSHNDYQPLGRSTIHGE